jgi:hypothetical protein
MTLQEAIAAYVERREQHGVDIPGGVCIAEDHSDHDNCKEK